MGEKNTRELSTNNLVEMQSNRSATRWLISGGALVTLTIWSNLFDPFNAPKSWVLSISAMWLFGWILYQLKLAIKEKTLLLTTLFATLFAITLFLAWLATDNKYIGFFGEYQRRTGFLSYFCLIVFLLSAAYLIRINKVFLLEASGVLVGTIVAIYGFAQHYKIDFIKWNNPYNSVLSTLGNPDFAAAAMAIFLVISFGVAIRVNLPTWLRIIAAINVPLLLIVIIFSQVRQGLLASAVGLIIIASVWLWQRSKIASWALAFSSLIVGILSIAGMLQYGPLTKYLFKDSVTFRGDYWRAGWRMFVSHPIFGVGLDRYGAYFTQYRDATQSLRRGPLVGANQAHDIPIQLAATGGIFVLIAFLALTGFILWRGIVALREKRGNEQIVAAVIFASWITYQVQSLISIDNLGIAIWGYILGGAVVGVSLTESGNSLKKRNKESSILQPILSYSLATVMLVISILFAQSEISYHYVSGLRLPTTKNLIPIYEKDVLKPLTFYFKEPTFEVTAALDIANDGNFQLATSELVSLLKNDPRNSSAETVLAEIYEHQSDWKSAILIREKMAKQDPFNQTLLLQLGEDYKSDGNLSGAKSVIPRIDSWDPNSAESKKAHLDFQG